jgi:subfamily B ATP-binding cassette protein MsbA
LQQVKTDRGEGFEHDKVTAVIERTRLLAYRSKRTDSILPFLVEIMSGAAIMAMIVYGGSQVAAGERTLGALFSFMTAFLMAFEPMKQIGRFNNGMQRGLAAAERVFAVIDRPRNMLDPVDPVPFPAATDIRFTNVQFRYPGEDKQALSDIDLCVVPGERVALVGRSGAGKTTLFGLLLRLYDADAGVVTIGGIDVAAFTQHELRGHISVVSQNPVIFNDTVLNNLRYGRPEATDAEVMAAAEVAAADGFIRALPDGYKTALGDQGLRLSGGQRQRLSIARALLRDAPILLLDEATSALDSESEQVVNAAINNLATGRTTIVIAHRLATVIDADRIYVLDAGTVVDSGTHAELMAHDGLYAALFAAQRRAG